MAKKMKRKVSQVSLSESAVEAPEVQTVENAQASAAPRPASLRRGVTTEFNPDYSYVVKDLKRIGTLAGTFFVVLIVLSFIIK